MPKLKINLIYKRILNLVKFDLISVLFYYLFEVYTVQCNIIVFFLWRRPYKLFHAVICFELGTNLQNFFKKYLTFEEKYLKWFFLACEEKKIFCTHLIIFHVNERHEEMVFCYQNCPDLLWEKIVLVIEKKN